MELASASPGFHGFLGSPPHAHKRDPNGYHHPVNESTDRERIGRWARRESRRRAERQRLKKHGATIKRIYRDAVLKRLKERRKP